MKRIIFLIFIIVSVLIIYNFSQSIYRLLSKKNLIIEAQNQLKKVQKENTQLKKELAQTKNPEFVEEQAHDKLFLVKPGENTVVIPTTLLPTPEITKTPVPEEKNWQKWLKAFSL